MRYIVKQKMFSMGKSFYIKTAEGEKVFSVSGNAFAYGDQLSFKDMSGNELVYINQKMFRWRPTYHIYKDGKLSAVIKKKRLIFLCDKFMVDAPGLNNFEVRGNFRGFEYSFLRGDTEVARVSKKWFTMTDTYGVDIHKDEDDVMVLAVTVVFNVACHTNKILMMGD